MITSISTAKTLVAIGTAAFTTLGGGFASADIGMGTYVDEDYPDSCLVLQNHTGSDAEVRLNYPIHGGSWTVAHDEVFHLADDGYPVMSPTGAWSVQVNPPAQFIWNFDPGLNTGLGCNGSWVLTFA
ncbi:hypothetical protein [Nocardia sp. NPDC004415]